MSLRQSMSLKQSMSLWQAIVPLAFLFSTCCANLANSQDTEINLGSIGPVQARVVETGGVWDFQANAPAFNNLSIDFNFGMSGVGFIISPTNEKEIDVTYEVDGKEKAKAETTLNTETGVLRIDFYTLTKPKEDAGKGYGTKVLEKAINKANETKEVTKTTGILGDTNKDVFIANGGADDNLDALGKTPLGKSMKALGFVPTKIKKNGKKWEFEFEKEAKDDDDGSTPSLD